MSSRLFDVAVLGSGFAGSALAAILAREGMSVVLIEAGTHPRFAIGESMILETSEMLRALAALYDVPELAYFSAEPYLCRAGTSHGVKRHFGFVRHDEGGRHDSSDPLQTLQAVIPREPHGHELHLFRQDADAALVHAAVRYGADVRQRTRVERVDLDAEHVRIETSAGEVRARFVADATGPRSVLVRQLGLAPPDPGLRTHSRALFTHMVGVAPSGRTAHRLPFRMEEGTIHDVFPGGWLWRIPFGNHRRSTNPLTSVGLVLDPRVWPDRSDLAPEVEFRAFMSRFPALTEVFAGAQSVRPWTRTGRIQHRPTRTVGERWALVGMAAGFVDPLFSKGLYASLHGVALLAHALLATRRPDGRLGIVPATALQTLAEAQARFLAANDRIVAASMASWHDARLWKPVSVLWLLGAYAEFSRLLALRFQTGMDRDAYTAGLARLSLVGGGFEGFQALSDGLTDHVLATDPADAEAVDGTVQALHHALEAVEWMPAEFRDVLRGRTHLSRHKLRLAEVTRPGGVLGRGAFRQAVFGDLSLGRMASSFARDKLAYSHPS
ncbi:NAD(P)/FAD-dependent oxidoreductase [Rubrivirga sp.]|uniref:NAD(P)/FAD-dependent oxidoreductase n=1 Tax=Rubrivirga sp. TaxID=1885344 RepID=UPI003C7413E5